MGAMQAVTTQNTKTNRAPARQHNNRQTVPEAAPESLLRVSQKQRLIQRKCACGGSCPSCSTKDESIQPKLKIGAPNDKYEQEADQVADQIMRMPDNQAQRQFDEG